MSFLNHKSSQLILSHLRLLQLIPLTLSVNEKQENCMTRLYPGKSYHSIVSFQKPLVNQYFIFCLMYNFVFVFLCNLVYATNIVIYFVSCFLQYLFVYICLVLISLVGKKWFTSLFLHCFIRMFLCKNNVSKRGVYLTLYVQ